METFEKLDVWKEAKALTLEVYRGFRGCRDFSFRNQIQRAALSVSANIAEGVERNSAAEFKNFLGIAKGSAGELRALIIIAVDLAYLENDQLEVLLERCVRISKRIHCLIKSLENCLGFKREEWLNPGISERSLKL
jgi:four helix bundle protein